MTERENRIINEYTEGNITHKEMENKLIEEERKIIEKAGNDFKEKELQYNKEKVIYMMELERGD